MERATVLCAALFQSAVFGDICRTESDARPRGAWSPLLHIGWLAQNPAPQRVAHALGRAHRTRLQLRGRDAAAELGNGQQRCQWPTASASRLGC
jgi:hypothetical protein